VEEHLARERLAELVGAVQAAGARAAVHCCAPGFPVALLRAAGFDVLAFDALASDRSSSGTLDALGEAIEAGCSLVVGVVPSTNPDPRSAILSDPSRTVEPARRLWRRLGFAPERLGEVVAVSPTCGLAGASPQYARAALAALQAAARLLVDEPA
jgi:methionine synthase II (cobalamin-independent)